MKQKQKDILKHAKNTERIFFFSFLVKGEGKEKKRPLLASGHGT